MSDRIQKSNTLVNTNSNTRPASLGAGVVVDVILDESHPIIKNKKNLQSWFTEKDTSPIGGVVVRKFNDITSPNETLTVYLPLDPYNLELPLRGESIELYDIGGSKFYRRYPGPFLNTGNAGLGGRENYTYPDKDTLFSGNDYSITAVTGTPLGNTPSTGLQSSTNLGDYFEPQNINKLKPFEGDKIIQSRFGQSIRFSGYNNNDNDFSPTIIIRNKQNTQLQLKEGDVIQEDINNDGSIIVLSSGTYQIPFTATTSINPSKFSTYPNPLKGDDHLLINSGKIIISAKTGQMVFHSKGDYGFISDGKFSIDGGKGAELDFGNDVNITTDRNNSNFSVNTGNGKIFLNTNTRGQSPNTGQTEPLVRGNTLKEILETMIDLINSQVYRTPSGPTAVGPENRVQFNALKRKLSEMLSTLNYTE
jgi:hypothetical protein